MWVFTKSGFFSAVQHSENEDWVHVRARFKGDLQRLCKAHGVKPRVSVTPHNDYRFRMNFTKEQWSEILKREAEGIDYTNFKNAVHDGTLRDRAYMQVWSDMRGAQDGRTTSYLW